jgi:hypothetical protein
MLALLPRPRRRRRRKRRSAVTEFQESGGNTPRSLREGDSASRNGGIVSKCCGPVSNHPTALQTARPGPL